MPPATNTPIDTTIEASTLRGERYATSINAIRRQLLDRAQERAYANSAAVAANYNATTAAATGRTVSRNVDGLRSYGYDIRRVISENMARDLAAEGDATAAFLSGLESALAPASTTSIGTYSFGSPNRNGDSFNADANVTTFTATSSNGFNYSYTGEAAIGNFGRQTEIAELKAQVATLTELVDKLTRARAKIEEAAGPEHRKLIA